MPWRNIHRSCEGQGLDVLRGAATGDSSLAAKRERNDGIIIAPRRGALRPISRTLTERSVGPRES